MSTNSSQDDKPNVMVREGNQSDFNYIINSWLEELWNHHPNYLINKNVFNKNYSEIIKKLLSKSHVQVAVDEEDHEHIYGYVIFESINDINIVHWINVKLIFRGFKIAELLMNSVSNFGKTETLITHLPRYLPEKCSTKEVLRKYQLKYDPFIIHRRIHEKT